MPRVIPVQPDKVWTQHATESSRAARLCFGRRMQKLYVSSQLLIIACVISAEESNFNKFAREDTVVIMLAHTLALCTFAF